VPLIFGFTGGQELLVIALVILLLFGGSKIPKLMGGMGQGIREFRKEIRGGGSDKEGEEEPEKVDEKVERKDS
jgi:sec-independent protein translocase protein TatA